MVIAIVLSIFALIGLCINAILDERRIIKIEERIRALESDKSQAVSE